MDRYRLWLTCAVVTLVVATLYVGSKSLAMGVTFGLAAVCLVYGMTGLGIVQDVRQRFLGFAAFPAFIGLVGFLWFGSGSSLVSLVYLVGGLLCTIGLFSLWMWWSRQEAPTSE